MKFESLYIEREFEARQLHVNPVHPSIRIRVTKAHGMENAPFGSGQRIELLLRTFNEDHEIPEFLPSLPYGL